MLPGPYFLYNIGYVEVALQFGAAQRYLRDDLVESETYRINRNAADAPP